MALRPKSYARKIKVMTQGEPVRENSEARIDSADAETVAVETTMPPVDGYDADDASAVSESATPAPDRADREELDALASDVQTLLTALSEEERQRDAAWEQASQTDDGAAGSPAENPAMPEETAAPGATPAPQAAPQEKPAPSAGDDDTLSKVGHALGIIAQRIDNLEGRLTDRAITDIAMAAAPSAIEDDEEEDDPGVAPYIARAEKELKAKKRKSASDIFDRIAQAAESEFNEKSATPGMKIIDDASKGRRVGTKSWQPASAIKRRMQEAMEAAEASTRAKTTAQQSDDTAPSSTDIMPDQTQETSTEALTAGTTDGAQEAPALDTREPIYDRDDFDDSGLSVVPGARGRRRNRARKTRLDEDFENVFAEEDGDKSSIQSLRRKMRERAAEAPVEEEEPKGGMLGSILGRKSAKKSAIEEEVFDDELDSFDDIEKEETALKKTKTDTKKQVAEVDDDDEEDDWDEEEPTSRSSLSRPVLYIIIAAITAAGFFAVQTFMS